MPKRQASQYTQQTAENSSTRPIGATMWPIQQLYLSGSLFSLWKSSTIIPIPKNAAASEAKEFRPLALTSTISRLFERLLLKFLKPYLTDTTQFAYQQHRSTEDTLAHLLDIVTNHLDIHAKNHARCLFIDFSSAFNTISPTTPCNRLQDTSLNPAVLDLVYDFMTNCSQKVLTEQSLSSATLSGHHKVA